MTRYSIIIPHRGTPEELRRLLASIPQREDVEVVVVEDAEGRGGGYARNRGLERATGEWLLFADADDYYCPDFLDVLDGYATRTDIDVLYFGFDVVNSVSGEHERPATVDIIQHYDDSPAATERLRYKLNSPWSKMVRRSFVQRHALHFEETLIANDLFFSLMTGHFVEHFAVERRPLYTYVHYPASQTNRQWTDAKVLDYFGVNLRANRFFRHIGRPRLARRPHNLWLEAWHTGGLAKTWAFTRCYLAHRRELMRHADDYVEFEKQHR